MRYSVLYLLVLVLLFACNPVTERISGYQVHGVDVSHYQSVINWDTLLTQKVDFVFVKATEGESIQDSFFLRNWTDLGKRAVARGAYHFFHPAVDIQGQLSNFKKTVQLEYKDLPPVVDFEVTNGKSKEFIQAQLKLFLESLEQHYGIAPIIYTNQKLYNYYLESQFDQYPLWIARYNDIEPNLVDGRQWDFWQYGNRGQLKGVSGDIDFNVFKGDLEALKRFAIPLRDSGDNVVDLVPI